MEETLEIIGQLEIADFIGAYNIPYERAKALVRLVNQSRALVTLNAVKPVLRRLELESAEFRTDR